jgi:glycosyltransferase involved in cell wall biosynthesis
MKVSVIIPAFNEEQYLSATLAALQLNDFPKSDYEIIVVNNGSTDRTSEIAQKAGVRLVETGRRFVGAARNLAAREATGEIFAFLDADCVPALDWLREGVRSLSLEYCITGAKVGVPDDAGWMERVWFSQSKKGRIETTHINSGNLFVPRALFHGLEGFDESLSSGEDAELCMRAKSQVRIIADDSIRVVHLGNPKSIKAFVKREVWHGMGALSSAKLHWFDKPLIGTVLFVIFSAVQVVGLAVILVGGSAGLLAAGTVCVAGVLVLTVLYRVMSGASARDALPLIALYFLYYLGRSLALGMLLLGRTGYQRAR